MGDKISNEQDRDDKKSQQVEGKTYCLIVSIIPEEKLQKGQNYSLRNKLSYDVMSQVNAVDI